MMTYLKRKWEESRGDEYDSWGTSVWYFAVSKSTGVVREQIEIFSGGQALFYDEEGVVDDKYGGLSEISLDLEEWKLYEISKVEYENVKNKTTFINR